ncbi:hypothetical protein [Paenibacillus oralis]|uniref:hypothetical protein n=1 Tax=Paenibacillus oralis TaxID=2490856 RepID=UPI0015A77F12|nr:hypothetical protein [Paenibacillus oralis]
MDEKELLEIKQMAINYSDPVRGKLLALITYIELMTIERNTLMEQIERQNSN